jgi:hypothetical protein
MVTMYLLNILHRTLIYQNIYLVEYENYLMFIIILEYTWNMAIHTHSKYTFVNPNIYIQLYFLNTQNALLNTHKAIIKLVAYITNGT